MVDKTEISENKISYDFDLKEVDIFKNDEDWIF
jgi:hypothetical protein